MGERDGRTRTVAWEDPAAGAGAAAEMSGLEYLRAIGRGELPAAPIADLLGFGFHEIEEGRVVFECVPAEYHYKWDEKAEMAPRRLRWTNGKS